MRFILIIASFIFFGSLTSCNSENDSTNIDQEAEIKVIQQKMDEQIACWNNGDIHCYMQHYWHSDSLMFIGKSGVTYGWDSTLNNYLESYPDKKNMGLLHFENEVIRFLDDETVQVIGAWSLDRGEDLNDLEGHYSLIWKRKEGEWVIISDHSS